MTQPPSRTVPTSIAARLKSLRHASGRSLEDLAGELGVHFTTVSSWERGRSRPNYRTLSRLAAIFQVSPEYLLEEFADAAAPGRLVPGPSSRRFQRLPDAARERLANGLEEIRFLLLVHQVLDERRIRPPQLGEATGISDRRLEALLDGGARPTVSEVLILSDALGIRMEERGDGNGTLDLDALPEDPDALLEQLRGVPTPARGRLVQLLGAAVRLAVGAGGR